MKISTPSKKGTGGASIHHALRFVVPFMVVLLTLLIVSQAQAQCPNQFSTNLTSNNSSGFGTTVEIKAERALSLCRLYASNNSTASQTASVTVWAHPGGLPWAKSSNPAGVNDNQWFCLGTVSITMPGDRTPTGYTEIPVDLSVLGVMVPGQKWGFLLQSSGIGYMTGAAPYILSNGDITFDTETWGPTGSATCPSTTSFTFSNFPRQYCGKVTYSLVTSPNDAGIASVDSPLNFCAGAYPITVTLQNFGTNPITSATINWTLNGVPQTPVSWTGFLDTATIASRKTSVTLASSYNFLSNVPYTIAAWTSMPNGQIDTVNINDSTIVTRKAAISGIMTIGPSGDYSNFSDAVDDLALNGICGPVVFRVSSGTYNEQFAIPDIPGASAINTITFESQSGNRTDVTLSYSSSGTGANYVVSLNGCDYVTFRNMSITGTNGSYSTAVLIQGGAENCTIENCILTGPATATTSTYNAVIYSPSGSLDHNLTIKNNLIQNGSYGMYLYGSGTSALERNILVENNTITNFGYMGIYAYYQDSPNYLGNTITSANTSYNYKYASYMYYNYNALRYMNNKVSIIGPLYSYGVLCYYSVGTSTNYGIIANNFMEFNNGNTYYGYGLRTGYGDYTKVMFNTIYVKSNSTYYAMYTYNGSNYHYSNNISIYDGAGYAWYCYPGSNVTYSDHNVLLTTGANFSYWNSSYQNDLAGLKAASGQDQNSISKMPEFASIAYGDLHLTSVSEDDPDLVGAFEPEITVDIDGEPRMLPYRGADEACYIIDGTVWYELTDGNGTPAPYANVPGTMGVRYHVGFPAYDANITITLRFYSIPGNILTYTTSFQVNKLLNLELDGVQLINLSGIAPGVYRVEAVFNTKNSCGGYRNYIPSQESFMLLPAGQQPCIVWPGDVNNDGIVNYGDRKSLNTYIHNANLDPTWLTGPARYRADGAQNPLTYLSWEAQAAVPWATPEGCYMDSDGNGTVNSFDYIGMKTNWMRAHDPGTPKSGDTFSPQTFDMSQNFPNPFNPTTQIQFSVPERSTVNIEVLDMLGRSVAKLASGVYEEGVHTVTFDASGYSSGVFTTVATMTGEYSGLSFSKTIRMNLTK